jgi:hypothetical protein
MGKIRGNNPLFTTKLHFVENFVRMNTCKGYNYGCKGIDFIGILRINRLVGKSGNVENSRSRTSYFDKLSTRSLRDGKGSIITRWHGSLTEVVIIKMAREASHAYLGFQ